MSFSSEEVAKMLMEIIHGQGFKIDNFGEEIQSAYNKEERKREDRIMDLIGSGLGITPNPFPLFNTALLCVRGDSFAKYKFTKCDYRRCENEHYSNDNKYCGSHKCDIKNCKNFGYFGSNGKQLCYKHHECFDRCLKKYPKEDRIQRIEKCIFGECNGGIHCNKHICKIIHCKNPKKPGSNYCNEHKCPVESCNNRDDCEEHICPMIYCDESKASGDSRYCNDHECKFESCHNYRQCKEHKCESHNCLELKTPVSKFCEYHTCPLSLVEQCNTERIYCKEHVCIRKGCLKERAWWREDIREGGSLYCEDCSDY